MARSLCEKLKKSLRFTLREACRTEDLADMLISFCFEQGSFITDQQLHRKADLAA